MSFQSLHQPACSRFTRGILHKRSLPKLSVVRAQQSGGDRQPWDFGTFLKTVVFFNKPPSLGEIVTNITKQPWNAMKVVVGAGTEEKKEVVMSVLEVSRDKGISPSSGRPQRERVMVAGATGELGKRVVAELLARGYSVRALIRDVEKGKRLLANLPAAGDATLELAPVDISQRQTLVPEFFKGGRALIICSAAKVAPKEGDTPDRQKYRQGIKFYEPEIVGDTPESVDFNGILNLLARAEEHLGKRDGQTILSPTMASEVLESWGSLDDVVMGGCSSSSISLEKTAGQNGGDAIVFRGTVTSANNGGFASVRRKNLSSPMDLGAYEGIQLVVKGNGQRYKMILRADPGWDTVGYCKSFDTEDGVWQTIQLPFSEFLPVFRGNVVKDAKSLDLSSVMSFQLMLSKFEYDGGLNPNFKLGDFSLPIEDIRTYMKKPVVPRVVMVSSGGVTKCNRPGLDLSKQPPAVRMNDELGGILTYKLKGEDAIRDSGIPFAIVRPSSLTDEPKGAPMVLDQGDDLLGKCSRDDIAELLVELLGAPTTTDTTFEVSSTIPRAEVYTPEVPLPKRDWDRILSEAKLRKGVTGKTIDGVYTGRNVETCMESEASK